METGIKFLYHGKRFSNIEKSKDPDEEELLTVAVAQEAERALEDLRAEVEKEGGEITINFKSPGLFEVYTERIPDNLKEKVLKVLRPPG